MSRQITVTPEELESAAARIEGLAEDYKDAYEALYKETGDMASAWSGTANTKFTSQIEGFRGDFDNMYSLMENYATFLRQSKTHYENIENEIAEEAARLKN